MSRKGFPEVYRVLFMDPFEYRHPVFRVEAKDTKRWAVSQYHAYNVADFRRQLRNNWKWDVLFWPAYVISGGGSTLQEENKLRTLLVNQVCTLEEHKRPNLIVFHGMRDDFGAIEAFREAGYKVAHQPFTDKQHPGTKVSNQSLWEDN